MPGDWEGLRILMYHRVTDAHPGHRLCVPVARFEEQMRWLAEQGYRTISFAEAVEFVKGQETGDGGQGKTRRGRAVVPRLSPPAPRPQPIVLTFDDGFEDNYLYAAPAMARYGFTGIFFVPSGFIAAGADGHAPADRPMTWEQLQALMARGHEIGAHSISHAKLTTVDAAAVQREVGGSKAALERRLARLVDFFCYPSGDYDDQVKRVVAASGYRGACTVEPGANAPGADVFALRRTEVSAFDTLWDFKKKLAGAYDWMHRMVQGTKR